MTKLFFIASAIILAVTAAQAQSSLYGSKGSGSGIYGGYGTGSNSNNHYVAPSISGSGTYTGGHHQTNPNNTQLDNYGTRGNVNPYTGAIGTRSPRY